MESENYLLNRLDQPLRFLGVNKDEALAFMGPLFMGFLMGYQGTGLMAALLSLALYRSFKKRNQGAGVFAYLYWNLPTTVHSMKLYIPSHIREFLG